MMSQVTGVLTNPPQRAFSAVRSFQVQAQARWAATLPKTRTAVQMAALLGIIVVAYNYSLTTLLQLADLNTPLAYVSLVPLISLMLAFMHARPRQAEPAIHDRQTDYIIGIPDGRGGTWSTACFPRNSRPCSGCGGSTCSPCRSSSWGCGRHLRGAGALAPEGRRRVSPAGMAVPLHHGVAERPHAFTSATLFAMARVVKATHIATLVGPLSGGVFSVVHNGHPFSLSVVSACSGVSSVVGFLLVGTAFAFTVRGPWIRKTLWLLGGMVLLWAINVGRITLIFWTGQQEGEHFAIDILHPYIGLVTFSLGVVVMILCIRPLGLHFDVAPDRFKLQTPQSADAASASRHVMAVPRVYLAVAIVLVLGILVGFSNVGLQSYNLVANVAGETKLSSYIDHPVAPNGWRSTYETSYTWAEPLFGEGSIWSRYVLYPQSGGNLHAHTSVVADVIDSPQLETFSAYGVEQCYEFHGYSLANVAQVSLGGGITGQTLAYTSQQYGSWTIVYWILPVTRGSSTVYERVVLYVQNERGLDRRPAPKGKNLESRISREPRTTASSSKIVTSWSLMPGS